MSTAPNETQGQYTRKRELMAKLDADTITQAELQELRELAKVATSHLEVRGV